MSTLCKEIDFLACLQYRKPVSYTHLDVYKRQLLHISEIDWKRLETIEEAGLKEGDEIEVKLLDIDPKTGKFKLSHKVLLPRPEKQEKKYSAVTAHGT